MSGIRKIPLAKMQTRRRIENNTTKSAIPRSTSGEAMKNRAVNPSQEDEDSEGKTFNHHISMSLPIRRDDVSFADRIGQALRRSASATERAQCSRSLR